jgi:GNAT superfamily N-acetyltransferase
MGWIKTEMQFTRYVEEAAAGSRVCWLAEIDGEVAGYVTLARETRYPPLSGQGVPEVMDLNVLIHFRRCGVASRLLDAAEAQAAAWSPRVVIAVGLHAGYNAAQRLHVTRGYVPDGRGVIYGDRFVGEYESVKMDDSLTLHLTKELATLSAIPQSRS